MDPKKEIRRSRRLAKSEISKAGREYGLFVHRDGKYAAFSLTGRDAGNYRGFSGNPTYRIAKAIRRALNPENIPSPVRTLKDMSEEEIREMELLYGPIRRLSEENRDDK